jgi:hypothetical protein
MPAGTSSSTTYRQQRGAARLVAKVAAVAVDDAKKLRPPDSVDARHARSSTSP